MIGDIRDRLAVANENERLLGIEMSIRDQESGFFPVKIRYLGSGTEAIIKNAAEFPVGKAILVEEVCCKTE